MRTPLKYINVYECKYITPVNIIVYVYLKANTYSDITSVGRHSVVAIF